MPQSLFESLFPGNQDPFQSIDRYMMQRFSDMDRLFSSMYQAEAASNPPAICNTTSTLQEPNPCRELAGPQSWMQPLARAGLSLIARPSGLKMDVSETEHAYQIHADVPGIRKDEIHVHIDEASRIMTIEAERRQEKQEHTGTTHLTERSYGKVQRSLTLPDNADVDAVKAAYADGVLSLTVPKRAVEPHKETRKTIAIE